MDEAVAEVVASLRPQTRTVDLSERRRIHIVGIGGAGMRAIARVLIAMGHEVHGSDRTGSRFLDELEALGATVNAGHKASQIDGADLVTRSTAVPDDNVEVAAALASGIDVYTRAEVLAAVARLSETVLVAGTHGKTTTSSMLAVLLDHSGRRPSFVIGSDVGYFGTGARWNADEVMVIEADESDGTFLTLPGTHAIVTSLDPDHLDYYGSAERLHQAFGAFVDQITGTTVVCIDDPDTHSLIGRERVITYGTHPDADFRLDSVVVDRTSTRFDVVWFGDELGPLTVELPGQHNALNAAGAAALALSLGVPFDDVAAGLAQFSGVARRFEQRGSVGGVVLVDDYAHLPAEVEVAVATASQGHGIGWSASISHTATRGPKL